MKSLRSGRQNIQLKMLLRLFSKGRDRGGFTLIELLVAMLISGLIVSGLLYLVVEVLGINQKDASRSDTQRDMQLAMDYITRDLREALYVYGTEVDSDASGNPVSLASCLSEESTSDTRGKNSQCTGLLNYLPDHLKPSKTDNKNIPVLAFWKPEPLPEKVTSYCRLPANADSIGRLSNDPKYKPDLDRIPCVAQRMYTLVVYSLNTENNNNIWKGKARIKRYTLPHFSEDFTNQLKNAGWVAPVASDDKRPLPWPFGKAFNNTEDGLGDLQKKPSSSTVGFAGSPVNRSTDNIVLTDFVDYENVPDKAMNLTPTQGSGYCPAGFEVPNFKKFRPEFYACVRRGTTNENPEVRVVIKGNAAGRGGIPRATGEVGFQMESHVIGRSAYGKSGL
jgi:prepilin-type N-terminal cleavage/methylation domain-containing protein